MMACIERVPLSTEYKALKVLKACTRYQLKEQGGWVWLCECGVGSKVSEWVWLCECGVGSKVSGCGVWCREQGE